jgi:toxin ParE1/3/4
MHQVLLTPDAESSRIDIWLHIAQDSERAADRLMDRLDEKCRLYATQPLMGTLRPDLGENVRCFPVDNYVVIYQPLAHGILVLLVVHGSRDIPAVFREHFRPGPS